MHHYVKITHARFDFRMFVGVGAHQRGLLSACRYCRSWSVCERPPGPLSVPRCRLEVLGSHLHLGPGVPCGERRGCMLASRRARSMRPEAWCCKDKLIVDCWVQSTVCWKGNLAECPVPPESLGIMSMSAIQVCASLACWFCGD